MTEPIYPLIRPGEVRLDSELKIFRNSLFSLWKPG